MADPGVTAEYPTIRSYNLRKLPTWICSYLPLTFQEREIHNYMSYLSGVVYAAMQLSRPLPTLGIYWQGKTWLRSYAVFKTPPPPWYMLVGKKWLHGYTVDKTTPPP